MSSNFSFLKDKIEYKLFSTEAIEAEKVLESSPAMSSVGSRKALELAIKWVYSADEEVEKPYRDNLATLIYEPTFKDILDEDTWKKLPFIQKLGNIGAHSNKKIMKTQAITSLQYLFEFIQWIDFCYGENYEEREFDENIIPKSIVKLDESKIKEQESLIFKKDIEIARLRQELENKSKNLTLNKKENKEERVFKSLDMTEVETRKAFIDLDLQNNGWILGEDVLEEHGINDMGNIPGKKGYIDYLLMGKNGIPLAVIEAKRTSINPLDGRTQGNLYADAIERKYGKRPFIFLTNGFETTFIDSKYPERNVSGIFGKEDLEKLMNRRGNTKVVTTADIDDNITNRYYQKEAILNICEGIEKGGRKHLLVMATGTGKTRTAISLVDVLSKGNYITNVLFLADRTALVSQARDDFKSHLPDMSLCNLVKNKEDKNARIVFSTYPTILNAIDSARNEKDNRFFTPAHFDLIIIDESHRSIFKKYKAIFNYFDAITVGLTATPKTDVDKNTYEFFEMEDGVPTYAYDYETAVYKDRVLVPYVNIEVGTKILDDGIHYDELSESDKEKYEDDFVEDDTVPDYIPSNKINKFVFNDNTVDMVIQQLMDEGIKVEGGDRIGKTIIFAQNKDHAEFIVKRFKKLYPEKGNNFIQRVTCDDRFAQDIIDKFKVLSMEPHITVSVDMLDTGIDVPEILNLVFFKKVRSKSKFWQMIGRGTRLSPELECFKGEENYIGKKEFLIFDYLGNFEFFREVSNMSKGSETISISERIFGNKVKIIQRMQDSDYLDYKDFRNNLVGGILKQINSLNRDLISVQLERKYVEHFKNENSFNFLSSEDTGDLIKHIAPLVLEQEEDLQAKIFDALIYNLMVELLDGGKLFNRFQRETINRANELLAMGSIPQVEDNIPFIKYILEEEFWENITILQLEEVRIKLRGLMQFLSHKGRERIVYTNIKDEISRMVVGEAMDAAYDFENYKTKINRYIEENKDNTAIYKLRHNQHLTEIDFKNLENIFTSELGTKEDYNKNFEETPFGILVRKVAKMDRDSAMKEFSAFMVSENLNQNQRVFIDRIIDYLVEHGDIEVGNLFKPPFDRPARFINLFNTSSRDKIVNIIDGIRKNAIG